MELLERLVRQQNTVKYFTLIPMDLTHLETQDTLGQEQHIILSLAILLSLGEQWARQLIGIQQTDGLATTVEPQRSLCGLVIT